MKSGQFKKHMKKNIIFYKCRVKNLVHKWNEGNFYHQIYVKLSKKTWDVRRVKHNRTVKQISIQVTGEQMFWKTHENIKWNSNTSHGIVLNKMTMKMKNKRRTSLNSGITLQAILTLLMHYSDFQYFHCPGWLLVHQEPIYHNLHWRFLLKPCG